MPEDSPPDNSAAQYGNSFSDVYDRWYSDGSEDAVVSFIGSLRPSPASLFELGIGTGRMAIPLARAGYTVAGLDSSESMLDILTSKSEAHGISAFLGDASNSSDFPAGKFDIVFGGFNLLFNLTEPGAQQNCVRAVADILAPNGQFVLEAYVPRVLDARERQLVTRSVTADEVVLIATDADPDTKLVHGNHIELRDGSVKLRPWCVRTALPHEIDAMAAEAGLSLKERYENYQRTPFDADHSHNHVSVYERSE